jgi:MFS family permease
VGETHSAANRRVAWTLVVLLAINTANFFDRQILPAVQDLIKKEWDLSDTQLGALGTAFILLYAVIGLPLGRLADAWRRTRLLALGVGFWSLMTAASALATGFWSLFFCRLGVGVGEATCAPAATSLIGDLVGPARRARAMSVFMLGLPLGLGLSFIVSSGLARQYGWESAFLVAGLPGLVLAGLAYVLPEPPRAAGGHAHASGLPFLPAVRQILGRPTMLWIIASGALHNFNMYALGSFLSSFLQRYHRLGVWEAGVISGLVYGSFGAVGMYLAGWLGDWAYLRRVSGRLHVAWAALAISVPCLLLALQAPPGAVWQFAAFLLPACMMLYAYYGTVYSSIQDIIEPPLRGTAMAVYFCAMYLCGAVLGPVGTGFLSDRLARRAAEEAGTTLAAVETAAHFRAVGLHHAMYVVPILATFLVLVLFAASRTITRDHNRLRERVRGDHVT